jgi:hypothetical protein
MTYAMQDHYDRLAVCGYRCKFMIISMLTKVNPAAAGSLKRLPPGKFLNVPVSSTSL